MSELNVDLIGSLDRFLIKPAIVDKDDNVIRMPEYEIVLRGELKNEKRATFDILSLLASFRTLKIKLTQSNR